MDAQALTFPDASFDHLLLHLVVAVVPDPAACLREAARVLRPGGTATVFDKLVPHGKPPSLLRRILNPPARFLATDLTRSLEPLLEGTRLRIEHQEPAAWGGFFRTVLLRLPETEPGADS
jgi:phosphatidylethanolamine/phosphatidyl-N-methylethanolamine N-methyltransferase